MSKFKAGDRVVIYERQLKHTGVVVNVLPRGHLHVEADDILPRDIIFSPQQCRRLVKKKRRSVWVSKTSAFRMLAHALPPDDLENYIEFREVLKREKTDE